MRKIKLESVTEHTPKIFRVLSLNNLEAEWLPNQSLLIPITIVQEVEIFDRYIQAGLDNLYPIYSSDLIKKVGENNLFICVEDRYYKDKWEDIVLKHLNFF